MARKSKVLSKSKGPKQKDFTKVKNKVGKKKQEKANEMKTDFKVKKVQMPAQNALEEKGEEVTHRKLGLSELLAHLQHHSSKVRRDALRGLLELCRDHPGVLNVNLSQILDSISLAATDGSADVRAALRSLQAFILDAMPQEALAAFGSTFALQVRSAISHVSSEVREDGLRLLELYLSRLGSKSVLTQGEASRLVSTLCQLHSHVDLVLPCLQQLLSSQGHAPPAESGHEVTMVAQVSLHDILDGKLQVTGLSNDDVVDSDIWEFCLRAWMQAGEMPRSAGGASASSGGWSRLRVAAVLEEGLTGILAGEKRAGSQPSAGQVATLSGIVRRQEWPIDVDDSSPFRPLADSINLRMARIMALLACGAAPIDAAPKHLQRLALASLAATESVLLKSVSSFAAHAHQLGSTASATATASAAALAAMPTSAENEVKPFTSTGSLCHGLLVLDLLWCCVSNSEKLWHFSDVDVQHLAEITAAVASGTGRQVDELLPTAAAILAVPLTASLLGLRPEGGAMLRRAWPSALEMRSPPLAEVIEKLRPGTLTSWVTSWPKMLWYLGSSHPKLSSFLMAIILKLGKAAESGSLHEKLLAAVLPLLVPFIAGMPGDQSAPPLAKLQDEGLQQMAAAMLFHFPRLRVSLVKAITDSVCRWSVAATGTVAGLGDSCCALMLEAVLQDRGQRSEDCNDELLIARLRASFSVLQLSPKSPSAELSTLKLCNIIAAWVMEDVAETYNSPFVDLQRPVSGYSLDQRRYLAFQHVAWPLCRQLAASEDSEMARRALCFFYLCARRLPGPTSSSKSGDDGSAFSCHISFLREVYRTLGQHALQSSPVFRELLPGEERNVDLSDARGGACLLVKAWMNATSSPDLAYELLVRLCVEQLAAEKGAGFVSAAWVLVESVTYRNSHGLCHDSWGCHPLGFNDVISREDLRQRVRDVMTSAQGQVVEHTLALLPLL